ncbi:hypothetical protein PNEG_00962 [Pneumocystis murina B123]|uniref:Protein kinase domain-containing protein n=1 Tax=Pneumocystis murina (strain B123) TaxID=1069680 RepID=M7PAF2_PNEMU|nr:hypothetical protein PNEG_00962 [Pneumocystis murina B123]EMR10815.1 hypothetical protein PNEG_00962 [Pneumocystis murina B123]
MYASEQTRKRPSLGRSSNRLGSTFRVPFLRTRKHIETDGEVERSTVVSHSVKTPLATESTELNLQFGRSPLKRSERVLIDSTFVSPIAKRNARFVSSVTTPKHLTNSILNHSKGFELTTPNPTNKLRKHVSVENFIAPILKESPFISNKQSSAFYSAFFSNGKQPHPLSHTEMAEEIPGIKGGMSISTRQTFCTPQDYRLVKPLQTVFMSTGLLSKRNRPHSGTSILPPETPCKRSVTFDVLQTPVTPVAGPTDTSFSSQEESFEGIDLSFLYNSSSSEFDCPLTPTKGIFLDSERFGKRWKIDSNPTDLSFFHLSKVPEHGILSDTQSLTIPSNCMSLKKLDPPSPSLLTSRFRNVELVGSGEFSQVYEVQERDGSSKFAVKKTKFAYSGLKERHRRLEEVNILRKLGTHEHIVKLLDSWEQSRYLYIQMELCDNGSLDIFLQEYGRLAKLDEFRVWKVMTELLLGLSHIHDSGYIHLDLKPANIFISFEGILKIGDFGMASEWPVPEGTEREGDREYIAPEVLSSQQYDKPADIFSLGLVILEVAANIVLPQNGVSWQKLRSGDFSDAPCLSSKIYSIVQKDISVPQEQSEHRYIGQGGLDRIVKQMLAPKPSDRPTAKQILETEEVTWVNKVRKAGAIIYEGDYGPIIYSTNDDKNQNWHPVT